MLNIPQKTTIRSTYTIKGIESTGFITITVYFDHHIVPFHALSMLGETESVHSINAEPIISPNCTNLTR